MSSSTVNVGAATVVRRKRLTVKPTMILGIGIVATALLMAFFPALFATHDPNKFDYGAILQAPSAAHWFGTDNFGRDVFSRVVHGARTDLQIALFTTLFPFIFGTLVGALTGYFGRWLDAIFGRIVDVVMVFPFLILVIAIVAMLGPGLKNMFIAVSIVGWVYYARLVRGETIVQKRSDYVSAARVMGYSPTRVVFRHIFPNAVTPAVVYWMTDMSLGILLGASLGYLGLGAQPPTAEWGVMVADGKNFMTTAPWISTFPGLVLTAVGVGFSLVGDGLADILRPK